MTRFTVVTTMTVEADDPKQAAMKVFALHDTMTPEDYDVTGIDADPEDAIGSSRISVYLEQDDKDEARRAYRAGEYFPEVDISTVKP